MAVLLCEVISEASCLSVLRFFVLLGTIVSKVQCGIFGDFEEKTLCT